MVSDLNKFIDFINYFKENSILIEEMPIYDSITNISKSDHDKALINSNFHIINLDKLCAFAYQNSKGSIKNQPSSMDGLCLIKSKNFKLFFIEFKGEILDKIGNEEYLKNFIQCSKKQQCILNNNSCYLKNNLNLLEMVYDTYENEIFSQLKIKPLESLFLVLPMAYEKYCLKENIPKKERIQNLYSFLTEIYSELIIVGVRSKNMSNSHILYKGSIKSKLKGKYSCYVPNLFNNYNIWDEEEFKENFLKKIVHQ